MAVFVYMLRCGDGSYYVGQTDDVEARMRQHEEGDDGYTAVRKPVEMVWQGEFGTRDEAFRFERQIKGWSRAKKEALIAGDWERVRMLARNRQALRQAQDEEVVVDSRSPGPAHPELVGAVHPEPIAAVHPEPVEGPASPPTLPHPEPVEGPPPDPLFSAVLQRQRRGIAKAITLLESTRADHRERADALLTALLPHTAKSLRLGISGVPGVGKSTFIESLGLMLIERGHQVAVLAVDPSSSVSGGSILGDKTRMERLSVHEHAYIRPSPAAGTLGGVAEKTREAMLVCEAAGYDIVIVETVGVGQSETAVAAMTDMFVLLQLPNAGDDLQAIKKGVMELADLVVINKADLDPNAATRAEAQVGSALHLLAGRAPSDAALWQPQVMQLSALTGRGLEDFWSRVDRFAALQRANGRFAARREQQSRSWMWDMIHAGLRQRFARHPVVREQLARVTDDVLYGRRAASTAARELLALFSNDNS